MSAIELRHINKYYGEGENRVRVLRDINLSIGEGDFVAIIGQSGSGKSTLMNIIGCLDSPSDGVYLVDGVPAASLDANGLARLRGQKFGFIFQRYNLLNSLNAVDNVALPAVYAGMAPDERRGRAGRLLSDLGLAEKLAKRPNELSGGQQQRVSIARALMNGGEIILADEPTGALDSASGEHVMDILMQLNARGHTVIVVTHDRHIAGFAHRVIEIRDGQVIADTRARPAAAPERGAARRRPRGRLLFQKDQFMESLAMSVQAIFAHKLRSILTMLGIIIGIASVVSVVALGRGSQQKILADISSMGTNTIDIMRGTGFGDRRAGRIRTLTVEDSDALAGQSYIASSTPTTTASGTITWRNLDLTGRLNGVGEQYFDVKGLELASGRNLTGRDVQSGAAVVIIDENTRAKLFPGGEDPIGQVLLFNRQPLEIIGLAKKQNASFGPADTLNLWSPYTTVMNRISGERFISSITVKVRDDVSPQVAEQNLTRLLTVRHGGTTDFFTVNSDSIRQTVESATGTMTLLISCIAFISLLVGGIGVMNIMLVSVTERTREIGVRMAIGARQANVLQQFLIEAVLICIIGGALGVFVSALVGLVFNSLVENFPMSFSVGSVLLALLCSTLIGVIFGYMPARSASRLNPVEALARE
ncbi:MAG: MacB family efflux pump subunit [Desulfovibrionaceae bacterium]|nr:MacB family efflux pump subunit [Desulfovibrionaceae bacterium]